MIARIPRGTPNTGDAKLAATTLRIVVRTINPAPGVATAHLDTPAAGFGISKYFLDFLLRMSSSSHAEHLQSNFEVLGCQVTTNDRPVLYIISVPSRWCHFAAAAILTSGRYSAKASANASRCETGARFISSCLDSVSWLDRQAPRGVPSTLPGPPAPRVRSGRAPATSLRAAPILETPRHA